RLVQGASTASVNSIGTAIYADAFTDHGLGLAMGVLDLSMTLGLVSGPVIGGLLYHYHGYRAVFTSAFVLIALDLALRLLVLERDREAYLDPRSHDQEEPRLRGPQDITYLPSANVDETSSLGSSQAAYGTITKDSDSVLDVTSSAHRSANATADTAPKKSSDTQPYPRRSPTIELLLTPRLQVCLLGDFMVNVITTGLESVLPLQLKILFGYNSKEVALILLMLVIPSFGGPLVGYIAGRYGTRPMISVGFTGLSPLLMMLRVMGQADFEQVKLVRFLLLMIGVCLNAVLTPVFVEVSHLVEERASELQHCNVGCNKVYAQAYALLAIACACGSLCGPLLGGLREYVGWTCVTVGAEKTSSPDSSSGKEPPFSNNYYDPDIARTAAAADNDDDLHHHFSPSRERRLLAKIDLRVIPVLSILYLLAFLDRTNIANASIFGLQSELRLQNTQYNTALTIFFVPYIVFEIPSNVLLKKLKPHLWLSVCMFGFGLVTICQGLVQNYSGLLATRFFLGLTETGMFPGSFYLIGMWYKRSEAQKRYSFFFGSTSLAGAFGGLLASAIGKMDGVQGYLGWRWIFILEGLLTCVVAFIFFFVIPDFPENAKWLTEEERQYVQVRLRKEQGRSAAERPIGFKDVVNVFKDYKIFVGGFMYFGLIVPAYSYAFFAPGIIQTYGYSRIQTQLYSVPPWAASFTFAMVIAYFSDKIKHRFAFTIMPICLAIAGFGILIVVHDNHHLQYGALFMVAMGVYSAMPVIVCWFNMNLGGHHRRAVGTAWQIGFGNIGGIIATYSFLPQDKADFYKPGYSICIAFICLSAASCLVYAASCIMQNRQREKAPRSLLTEFEKTELGDLNPEYRYLL
ncbi:MAG: hypothetical protein Q9192_002030, partial [Flavoplaca navasiana]